MKPYLAIGLFVLRASGVCACGGTKDKPEDPATATEIRAAVRNAEDRADSPNEAAEPAVPNESAGATF